jgi:hypothetical protein
MVSSLTLLNWICEAFDVSVLSYFALGLGSGKTSQWANGHGFGSLYVDGYCTKGCTQMMILKKLSAAHSIFFSECEPGHSSQSNAEVKNVWCSIFICLHSMVLN